MMDRQLRIDEYVATWNEPDPARRRTMIEQLWTEDGVYVDRAAEARGYAQINANIDRVHRKFPGRIYGRTSAVFNHRERSRFEWAIIDPAGRPTFGGACSASALISAAPRRRWRRWTPRAGCCCAAVRPRRPPMTA